MNPKYGLTHSNDGSGGATTVTRDGTPTISDAMDIEQIQLNDWGLVSAALAAVCFVATVTVVIVASRKSVLRLVS